MIEIDNWKYNINFAILVTMDFCQVAVLFSQSDWNSVTMYMVLKPQHLRGADIVTLRETWQMITDNIEFVWISLHNIFTYRAAYLHSSVWAARVIFILF